MSGASLQQYSGCYHPPLLLLFLGADYCYHPQLYRTFLSFILSILFCVYSVNIGTILLGLFCGSQDSFIHSKFIFSGLVIPSVCVCVDVISFGHREFRSLGMTGWLH